MSHSIEAIALLRAVLRDSCISDLAARRHLNMADQLGVDPLDYCAHRFGLGDVLVGQRAAEWAGVRFVGMTPSRLPPPRIDRIDHLGEARTLRQTVLGRDTLFLAPRFAEVVRLRESASAARRDLCFTTAAAIEAGLGRAASEQLMDEARQRLTRQWPGATASQELPKRVRVAFVAGLLALILLVVMSGFLARAVLIPIVALLLMAPGVMRLLAALPRRSVTATPRLLTDAELPVYSVLIPLRDEAEMVPMLRRAMGAIDYPPEKLDIKFVVESRSPPTVAAIEASPADPMFRMIVVPDGPPRTKPKALDYALPLARGKYVVVYDAEDVPEPGQLRLAASLFEADGNLACLQAELVPENASENALTALFAGEYAGLFGRLLPALARWGLPVPLGGTSNHFRMEVLRDIGGWDAFNVTEDADLGVRLARRGLRAETFASHTLEEAPLTVKAWMAQRTRWMKGWMQTFVVHNRAPRELWRDLGWRAFLGFQVLVGGMILSSVLHTVFILLLVARLVTHGLVGLEPQDLLDWFGAAILASGYGGAFAIQVSGLLRQKAYHLLPIQLLLPAYWVLHTMAAISAAQELIHDPARWAKTTHGVTRLSRGRHAGVRERDATAFKPRTG